MRQIKFNGEFHLAEYNNLRKEIELQISDRRKIEMHNFVAVFAIYAWLLSRPAGTNPELLRWAIGLPFLISIYGALMWGSLALRTMQIGKYLLILEKRFRRTPDLGWEHYLADSREKGPLIAQMEGQSGRIFWGILICVTGLFWAWFWVNSNALTNQLPLQADSVAALRSVPQVTADAPKD